MNLRLFSLLLFPIVSFAQFHGSVPSFSIPAYQIKSDTNTYDATRYWVSTMIGISDTGKVSTTGGDNMYGTYVLAGKLNADSVRTRKVHSGGNINYVYTDSVCGIRLKNETKVWKDVSISGLSLGLGPDAPAFTTGWAGSSLLGAYYYQGSVRDDIAYFTIQLNHDVSPNDSLDIHFHYGPTTLPVSGDTAVFKLTYVGSDIGSVQTPVSSVTIKVPLYGKAKWEHDITTMVFIPTGTGNIVSKVYNCSLQRLANSNASDNYTYNIGVLSIDAHAVIDRIGSNYRITN
jgi:hypothetical protein